jgi:hypothetical protein
MTTVGTFVGTLFQYEYKRIHIVDPFAFEVANRPNAGDGFLAALNKSLRLRDLA